MTQQPADPPAMPMTVWAVLLENIEMLGIIDELRSCPASPCCRGSSSLCPFLSPPAVVHRAVHRLGSVLASRRQCGPLEGRRWTCMPSSIKLLTSSVSASG